MPGGYWNLAPLGAVAGQNGTAPSASCNSAEAHRGLKDDQPELGAEGGLPYGCGRRGSSLAGLEAELVEFSGCLSREVTLVCLARGGGRRKLTGNGCKAGRLID